MTYNTCQLVLTTLPDSAAAQRLAETLVRDGLASCINILPSMQSIYRWKGRMETAQEHLVVIKCSVSRYHDIQERILSLHPYELPEIIAVPIADGLPAYLAWLQNPELTP